MIVSTAHSRVGMVLARRLLWAGRHDVTYDHWPKALELKFFYLEAVLGLMLLVTLALSSLIFS